MNSFFKSRRKKRRVLMVDDEQINRELLEAILSFNYDVDSAENGAEAMEMLRAAEEPYSLLLLDLLMPKKSGFQVIEECKADEELSKIPIIVLTTEKSAEVRSIRLGADDFITKPYRMPEVILARCERIIELSEERALIREIEKDERTELYKKDFFFAYLRRMETGTRRSMDAVVLRIKGYEEIKETQGQEKADVLLKKTAENIKAEVPSTKGMGCYRGKGVICACCKHREDYEELCKKIQNSLPGEFDGIRLKAGIYEKVDKTLPPEVWFERAASACDLVADGQYISKYEE